MDFQKYKRCRGGRSGCAVGRRSRYNRAIIAILPGSKFPRGSGRRWDTNSDYKSASVVCFGVSVSQMRIVCVGDLPGSLGLLCGFHVGREPL
jgi:hypothetical protein